MADHIVLGHPRRPYIKIEKVQLVEKQTDREKNKLCARTKGPALGVVKMLYTDNKQQIRK